MSEYTPEEQREQSHIDALAGTVHVPWHPTTMYRNLLYYFDKHEPAVADAIRYGLVEAQNVYIRYDMQYQEEPEHTYLLCSGVYAINKSEDES